MPPDLETQRIARLTPLADVLTSLQTSIEPVAARERPLREAAGKVLAADVGTMEPVPPHPLALRDGFAVRAELTADASGYAPVALSPTPPRVDVGAPLPDHADAVAPLESLTAQGAITAMIAPGDGVLAAGGDAPPGALRVAGARLRRIDVALLTAMGVEQVLIREPRLHVVRAGNGSFVDAAAGLVMQSIEADGSIAVAGDTLEAALQRDDTDAIVAIGGTGAGSNDTSVRTLARLGRVAFHGIGIAPGETTALGFVRGRPVLLLPGRLDAALAGWLTLGRRLLARLAFRLVEDQPFPLELSRKVASPLGVAEVVPVRRRLNTIEPMAGAYLSLQTLARSDGWILVPADSEGYAAGHKVPVRPWP